MLADLPVPTPTPSPLRHALFRSTALVAVSTLAVMLAAGPGWAGGGAGGSSVPGGADVVIGVGGAGSSDTYSGSGGGAGSTAGGAGGGPGADGSGQGGMGGIHGSVSVGLPIATASGTDGAAGAAILQGTMDNGGGGGAGGWGAVVTGGGALGTLGVNVTGGNGGWGGDVDPAVAGSGGSGGYGLYFDSVAPKSLQIDSVVEGGAGGYSYKFCCSGPGGVGVVGNDLSIILNGTIAGGRNGDFQMHANAINFTGGSNTLTLNSTAVLTGNIDVTGSLTFDQPSAYTLPYSITGTGSVAKTGAGTLTLMGVNTFSGGTTVNGGLINFSNIGNFGAGNITLNGGGLQWATGNTTDISGKLNPIGAGGAVFDTDANVVDFATGLSGTGSLTKTGSGCMVPAPIPVARQSWQVT